MVIVIMCINLIIKCKEMVVYIVYIVIYIYLKYMGRGFSIRLLEY